MSQGNIALMAPMHALGLAPPSKWSERSSTRPSTAAKAKAALARACASRGATCLAQAASCSSPPWMWTLTPLGTPIFNSTACRSRPRAPPAKASTRPWSSWIGTDVGSFLKPSLSMAPNNPLHSWARPLKSGLMNSTYAAFASSGLAPPGRSSFLSFETTCIVKPSSSGSRPFISAQATGYSTTLTPSLGLASSRPVQRPKSGLWYVAATPKMPSAR
mmetsp:Transcript_104141/g.335803  ORF Transcript_104141/g.335803 Transcript_104141/m.335803 type:complete len:217 (+) Transcript_104141:1117-1767(+)